MYKIRYSGKPDTNHRRAAIFFFNTVKLLFCNNNIFFCLIFKNFQKGRNLEVVPKKRSKFEPDISYISEIRTSKNQLHSSAARNNSKLKSSILRLTYQIRPSRESSINYSHFIT